jgi:FecR protein
VREPRGGGAAVFADRTQFPGLESVVYVKPNGSSLPAAPRPVGAFQLERDVLAVTLGWLFRLPGRPFPLTKKSLARSIIFLTISVVCRMFNRITLLASSLAVSICCLAPRPGTAADQVGLTVTVKKDVSQLEPQKAKILAGDNVIRNEVIQTLDDSGAKIVLKDSTNLVLGPNSKLKLDQAVFADEKGLGEVAIKLANGSFRFITGTGPKESYTITTPLATIGIRGTVLDLALDDLQNLVQLVEGGAQVCAGNKCVQLNPGEAAVINKAYSGQIDVEVTTTTTTFDWGNMGNQMTFAAAQDVTGNIGNTGIGGAAGGSGGGTLTPPAQGLGTNFGNAPIGATTFAKTQTPGFSNNFGLTAASSSTASSFVSSVPR